MATDTTAPTSNRPRPWLVIAFGVVLVAFLAGKFWPSPEPAAGPARQQAQAGASGADNGTIDPEDLKVRLEALKDTRPDPGKVDRNPFRFEPKAAPPPAPNPKPPPGPVEPEGPVVPPGPPPPPPIPLKFIGIVEGRGVGKVAAFSDCKRTFYGREGDIVDGRYRLLKIGVESVTMNHADGRGLQTIRMSGQDCIGK